MIWDFYNLMSLGRGLHHKTVFPQWLQQFVIVLQDDGNLIRNVTSVVAKLTTLMYMYYFIYTYMCMFTQ